MVSQPVCLGVEHPSGAYKQIFIIVRQLRVCWCGALSNERMGLPFTIAAGPRQCSNSWVQVPWDSWPYFTVLDSRLPQPAGLGPHIYIPQALGSLFITSYNSLGYSGGDSWPYFTVSDSRLPQPAGPGPHIYIPQEQGGAVISPGTGFPLHHFLQLAGLWWRYSNLPPRRRKENWTDVIVII
jgi:hypothetical protein